MLSDQDLRDVFAEMRKSAELGATSEQDAAVAVLPSLQSATETGFATFDQLWECYYGREPAKNQHWETSKVERAAYTYLYPTIRRAFEKRNGRIIQDYWATQLSAGAVRTERDDKRSDFHAIVDWGQDDAPFVEQLIALDELEVAARGLRHDSDEKTCMELIFSAYSSGIDALESRRSNHPRDQKKELELVTKQVQAAKRYYDAAADRVAYGDYTVGMAFGLAAITALAMGLGIVRWSGGLDRFGVSLDLLIAGAFAGAVGGTISVLARMTKGSFTLTPEASRISLRWMGAIRPFVGATFGAVVPLLSLSGIVSLGAPTDELKARYFYLGVAFIAGFSERWAPDLLSKQEQTLGQPDQGSDSKPGGAATPK